MFWAFFWVQIALAVGGFYLLWRGLRGREVDDHPHCKRCGYDLFGLTGGRRACPECGADLRSPRGVRVGVTRRDWALVAVALGCGGAAYAVGPVRQAAWRQWVQKPAAFVRAVAAGDDHAVDHLLASDPGLMKTRPPGQTLLDLAVSSRRPERVLMRLLSAGADPDEAGSGNGYRPLHRAAWEGKPGAVQVLLTAGANPDARDGYGQTPLHFAARGPSAVASCRMLLEAKADPNARDAAGRTPLHGAAGGKDDEVVQVLADGKADLSAADARGLTPLHVAAAARNLDMTMALVRAGANLAARTPDGRTPAQLARVPGNGAGPTTRGTGATTRAAAGGSDAEGVRFVALVYQKALQVRARDKRLDDDVKDALKADPAGLTESGPDGPLLHVAAALRQSDLAQVLLEAGADANLRDADGRTALHRAAWGHDPRTLSALLRGGADPNAKDKDGRTPLHVAADSPATERTARMLLDAGADPRARDKDGVAPLEYAATSLHDDREEVMAAMLQGGAPAEIFSAVALGREQDVRDLLDKDGAPASGGPGSHRSTPLHVAALYGRTQIAQLLLDRGADVNAGADVGTGTGPGTGGGYPGRTPLFDALGRKHLEVAALLLARGARCDLRNNAGLTPLHVAVVSGAGEAAVRLVLKHGADPHATERNGQTPLHLAAGYADKGTVQALLDAGADPAAKDPNGRTPLEYARRLNRPRPEVAELLEKVTERRGGGRA